MNKPVDVLLEDIVGSKHNKSSGADGQREEHLRDCSIPHLQEIIHVANTEFTVYSHSRNRILPAYSSVSNEPAIVSTRKRRKKTTFILLIDLLRSNDDNDAENIPYPYFQYFPPIRCNEEHNSFGSTR